MDSIKILRRAWQILWSYRTLWVFGLILALAGAGAHGRGSNNGVQYQTDSQGPERQLPRDMQEAFQQAAQEIQRLLHEGLTKAGMPEEQFASLIRIAFVFLLLILVLGVIVAIARYVAETAVIFMVDEYESTGSKMTIRQGFQRGWSRTSWRLFLINLLVNLPLILAVVGVLVVMASFFLTVARNHGQVSWTVIAGPVLIVFLFLFGGWIITIFLRLLRNFFWRVTALEDASVGESFRRGFQMARDNWRSVGLMWLVMIGLGIAWAILSVIAIVLTLPAVIVTSLVGLIIAGIPALLVGGVSSAFLGGWLPWIVGILFALPLFLVIALSPWLLLGSWQTVFTSTVWTLVYRELKALPALTDTNVSTEIS
jgi:hypothetical protein